jgi:hypothetical protein
MQPGTIISTLLRNNNSSPMAKAAHRLVMPLARLNNPELTDLAATVFGNRPR